MRERALFLVAEQEGDVGQRQAALAQVVLGERMAARIQHLLELAPASASLRCRLRGDSPSSAAMPGRRTRASLMLRIRAICQPEPGWDDARWDREQLDYLALWRSHYGLPQETTE